MMIIFTVALAVVLLTFVPVHGIKKCTKIDACRCSTDEGEINLWSLAGQTPNQPRFSLAEALVANISDQTKDSYQWNPCDSWTAQTLPNETAENQCKDVAVCLTREIDELGTFRVNIGEQKLSDCVLDQDNERCLLTYGVTSDKQIRTAIYLVCNETEEGRVDTVNRFGSLFYTSLYSKYACPGKSTGLGAGAIVGIVVGTIVAFLLLAFVVFICYLRYIQADGDAKPSICTTIKDGLVLIKVTCCPCSDSKRWQYSNIPGTFHFNADENQ